MGPRLVTPMTPNQQLGSVSTLLSRTTSADGVCPGPPRSLLLPFLSPTLLMSLIVNVSQSLHPTYDSTSGAHYHNIAALWAGRAPREIRTLKSLTSRSPRADGFDRRGTPVFSPNRPEKSKRFWRPRKDAYSYIPLFFSAYRAKG